MLQISRMQKNDKKINYIEHKNIQKIIGTSFLL